MQTELGLWKSVILIPSVAIFLDGPDVVVNLNPAGSVSDEPGIMLIPWTSRGGNCLRQEEPCLKFLSSLCEHKNASVFTKKLMVVAHPAYCFVPLLLEILSI